MEIGIRELRNNLAAIMDAVDKGAVVTITHHGKPRATLQPPLDRAESPIERGIREGWIGIGPGFPGPRRHRRSPTMVPTLPGRTASDVLTEDRADER